MTYKLEPFIEKITSPVVCIFDTEEVEYADGRMLSAQVFDRHWLIDEIFDRNGKIALRMKENDKVNYSESGESFF